MTRSQQTVVKALREELEPGARLLLAVSGGIDSAALLAGVVETARGRDLEVEVAHVDHGLRPNSAADALFVQRLSGSHGLQLHLHRAGPVPHQANVESWARTVRYDFFREVLTERKLDCVLTAHTANDAAETLLMRLLANKEPRGIMQWDAQRRCRRPLLRVSRAEIERFARARGLEHREDETNQDTSRLRNRVRHVLMPLLEQDFDARMVEVLSERAVGLAADFEFLGSLIEPVLAAADRLEFGSKAWLGQVREDLALLSPVLRWRYAELLFKRELGFNLGRRRGALLAEFLVGRAAGIELVGGLVLRRRGGGIAVER